MQAHITYPHQANDDGVSAAYRARRTRWHSCKTSITVGKN